MHFPKVCGANRKPYDACNILPDNCNMQLEIVNKGVLGGSLEENVPGK
jgi:hypothetical protein